MSDSPELANDGGKQSKTIAEQVLESFYDALAKKEKFPGMADRFRSASSRSENAIRQILFGDES
ncbi:MAG: hypothetical protein AB7S78_14350 [Candidatus Omnitrophota bacterium]